MTNIRIGSKWLDKILRFLLMISQRRFHGSSMIYVNSDEIIIFEYNEKFVSVLSHELIHAAICHAEGFAASKKLDNLYLKKQMVRATKRLGVHDFLT